MSSARPKLSPETPKAVTAWDTRTGRVIYLTPARDWSPEVADAAVLTGAEADEALAFALADRVRATDPYHMQVKPGGGVDGRELIRETIRARGPTNHPQFGRQAGNP
jgi:predicted glycosyltransferase